MTSPDLTDERPSWPDDGNQVCFLYELKDGAAAEYDRWHAEVFPGVIAGLKARGAYDYSIFRRGNLVITTVRIMEGAPAIDAPGRDSEDDLRWQSLMAPLFERVQDENGDPLYAQRVFRLD